MLQPFYYGCPTLFRSFFILHSKGKPVSAGLSEPSDTVGSDKHVSHSLTSYISLDVAVKQHLPYSYGHGFFSNYFSNGDVNPEENSNLVSPTETGLLHL